VEEAGQNAGFFWGLASLNLRAWLSLKQHAHAQRSEPGLRARVAFDSVLAAYLFAMKTAEQTARAEAERQANELAADQGQALPFPNPWDAIDPTKVSPNAPAQERQASYQRWSQLCRKRPRKVHIL